MKRLQKAAFINRLAELKAATDWAETPIFYMYERHGRWVHQNTDIYSDVQCKQIYSLFKSMRGNEDTAEALEEERRKLVKEHQTKTFRTIEVLMNQLNMQFYWENLKAKYAERKTTLEDLSKVMARSLKMYSLIDHIMKIFHLINKIEVSHQLQSLFVNSFIFPGGSKEGSHLQGPIVFPNNGPETVSAPDRQHQGDAQGEPDHARGLRVQGQVHASISQN